MGEVVAETPTASYWSTELRLHLHSFGATFELIQADLYYRKFLQ